MIDERFPSAAEVRAERDPEPGAVRAERDPEPVQHSFGFTCADCTNRAPICPSCWDVPAVEAAGRCPCAPPEHVFLCPGRWGNFAACAPQCRVRPYVAWLHALGGYFAARVRPDLGQPHGLISRLPEGVPFQVFRPLGRCGDHCGQALLVTGSAVRRGAYAYLPSHDPAPCCYRCGAGGSHICDTCGAAATALRGFCLALADYWQPPLNTIPRGFLR